MMKNKEPDISEKTVCFTGHRMIQQSEYQKIEEKLNLVIDDLIRRGFTLFLSGGALGFDTMAAIAVLNKKKEYPLIRLGLILPCRNQSSKWNEADQIKYNEILSQADFIKTLSPEYYDGCMLVRNRYLVDHSSLCICYLKNMRGGTLYTVAYAVRNGIDIINLAITNKNPTMKETNNGTVYSYPFLQKKMQLLRLRIICGNGKPFRRVYKTPSEGGSYQKKTGHGTHHNTVYRRRHSFPSAAGQSEKTD